MCTYILFCFFSSPLLSPEVHRGAVCDKKFRAAPSTRIIKRLLFQKKKKRDKEGDLCCHWDCLKRMCVFFMAVAAAVEQGACGTAPPQDPDREPHVSVDIKAQLFKSGKVGQGGGACFWLRHPIQVDL